MATLRDSFTKGITTLNVKTSSFMEESKCKTYISTLENEIRDLKLRIGEIAYEKWTNDEEIAGSIQEILEQIKNKYQEIQVQKERMVQISQEQQQILGTINTQQAPQVIYCSSCGASNDANYKFCAKCGSPLK